jgi:repressor LexA
MALTRRQREVLDFITDFIRTKRYSPSLEEIAQHFGLSSVATVHKHVTNLEKKGFIKRAWNRSRSIDVAGPALVGLGGAGVGLPPPAQAGQPGPPASRVAESLRWADLAGASELMQSDLDAGVEDAHPDVARLPLLGRVAAGLPIEAIEDRDEIGVPADMVGRARCFVLQVTGDSMIGEHIQDGDFVIVEERSVARDGERVIALLDNQEATLKTFRREPDGTVRLDPANPRFEPVRVRDGELRIQGVVIGVMRKYRR